ncbi:MAG: flavodoxin-dependent (E)-4-hydroxy-3-methylbut-2-enyl-diphosphate synthase, partial [Candidatus Omnitrophica bacterium]|nr:flavodoxin-dependent (E)-4-hydroxy-3-methylbut-2-enyl-diphosphate synthase [Candidatus Omnitrophota bacterium]
AYRCMAEKCDYPFHLGITAAGPLDTSLIKSSVGIGGLLSEGIGDTIRVSLTGAPEKEITVAKNILYSLGLVRPAIEIISCPTCGRCELDLEKMVKDIRKRIDKMMPLINFPPPEKQQPIPGKNRQTGLKIAVMGCVVNGPGEASEADIGVAGGRNCGVLFKNGKRLRKVKQINIIPALMKEIRELCKK